MNVEEKLNKILELLNEIKTELSNEMKNKNNEIEIKQVAVYYSSALAESFWYDKISDEMKQKINNLLNHEQIYEKIKEDVKEDFNKKYIANDQIKTKPDGYSISVKVHVVIGSDSTKSYVDIYPSYTVQSKYYQEENETKTYFLRLTDKEFDVNRNEIGYQVYQLFKQYVK